MDSETFRKHGHELIDWVADYLENIEDYKVKSTVDPGEIKDSLPSGAPMHGEPFDLIFNDFKEIILPGISHWQHPGWFAYFPANNSEASILGEILTASLGVQGMIWDTSPAATELEEVVMNWLRDMIGLPDTFVGVIQDTASTSTLCALLTARERASNFDINNNGFQKRLRIYASDQTHSSIDKGVKIAGFGKKNLVHIETDVKDFSIRPEKLTEAIEKDIQAGFVPCCVIGNLGTTSSMAMDRLDELASICQKYTLWFHVDAAFAGTAAVVPEYRDFMKGAEKADSFVFNPHKWMLTNFDCSAYFVKDPLHLQKTFAILPEYLKTKTTNSVNNYRDWGIQLGRRFRALKLWFVIRTYGIEGIQAMVKQHVELATNFAAWVKQSSDFELLTPVNLSLVCFRLIKPGMMNEELNSLNSKLMERINATGKVYLTHTTLSGKFCLRLAVGNRNTTQKHIDQVILLLKEFTKTETLS